jgi:hypothetical protein
VSASGAAVTADTSRAPAEAATVALDADTGTDAPQAAETPRSRASSAAEPLSFLSQSSLSLLLVLLLMLVWPKRLRTRRASVKQCLQSRKTNATVPTQASLHILDVSRASCMNVRDTHTHAHHK